MTAFVFYRATFVCIVSSIGYILLLRQKGQGSINRRHLWRGLLVIVAASYLLPLLGISHFFWRTIPGHVLSFLLCFGLPGALYVINQCRPEIVKKHFERLKWGLCAYVLFMGVIGATC